MVDTRWVVKCVPTESGIGFGQDKLYFKAPDFRTCGGDLWGVSVFPPGTDERELRGGHGMGLGRALNRATNQHSGGTHGDGSAGTGSQLTQQPGILAPNEWGLSLRRLSQETPWSLKAASAGLSRRFHSLSESFWDLSTQDKLNVNQSSPYTYSPSAWVVWRRSYFYLICTWMGACMHTCMLTMCTYDYVGVCTMHVYLIHAHAHAHAHAFTHTHTYRRSHIQELNPLSPSDDNSTTSPMDAALDPLLSTLSPPPPLAAANHGALGSVTSPQDKGVVYAEIHFHSFGPIALPSFM